MRFVRVLFSLVLLLLVGGAGQNGAIEAVFFMHGWGGDHTTADPIRAALADTGITMISPDMIWAGSNQSLDLVTRPQMLADALAKFDAALAAHHLRPEQACIAGTSAGAYEAALLAGMRHVGCVILHAPANYPNSGMNVPLSASIGDETAHNLLVAWRKLPLEVSGTTALQGVEQCHCSTLVIASELDTLVPMQTSQNFQLASHGKLEVLRGAEHAPEDSRVESMWEHIVLPWLRQQDLSSTRLAAR
jgi:pimeloyl-ACP methyl ester carboxylesterase